VQAVVAMQPWWFDVSILQLVLATRIFFGGDLQCFGFVPVFSSLSNGRVACRCAAVAGRRGRPIAYAGRLCHPEDAPPRAMSESGWRNSFDLGGGQVVVYSITIRHGCMAASAACVDSGPRPGGAGWANNHCPKRLKPARELRPPLVLSDMRLARTQSHTRTGLFVR